MIKKTFRSRIDELRSKIEENSITLICLGSLVLYSILIFYFRESLPSTFFNFDKDIQLNVFTINTVIIGFVFSGLGLLLGMCDKSRIRIYDHYGYMDNLYNSLKVGLHGHGLSIMCLGATLFFKGPVYRFLFIVEIYTLLFSLLLFVYSITRVVKLIEEVRKDDDISDLKF